MTGRTLAISLAAWGCGLATPCLAQGYGAGGVVTLPAEAGGFSYSSGAFGESASFGTAPASYSAMPPNCPPQGGATGVPCEPRPACWWKPRALFTGPRLMKPPRNAFVRLEYLLWEIEEPGNLLLGNPPPITDEDLLDLQQNNNFFFFNDFDETADILDPNAVFDDNFDPADGFFTFDPFTGFDFSYTPRLEEIQLRDNSGLRLTVGIPTYEYGTIELSGWLLEQASDHYTFGQREISPPFRQFVNLDQDVDPETAFPSSGTLFNPTILTTINGEATRDFFGFFTGFSGRSFDQIDVAYLSDLWGADAKFVVDALQPQGEGLKLKPLFGFKYVGFQEGMYTRGVQQPFFGNATISSINSNTSNTILGGTIGLRTELEHRWFVVGVQPAVTFAGNIAQVRVSSERLTGNDDPRREVTSDLFDFSPILDLNVYARICLSENLRLNVGYDAFWMSRVYRAGRVIDYDTVTDPTMSSGLRSNIGANRQDDHVAVEGLSVGLEYVF